MYIDFFTKILKTLTPIKMAMLSALIAIWIIYIQHGWVTVDSILYFEMAKHIANGNFQQAYAVEGFSWGFYPALIALVHLITGLGLQASANLLIVAFFCGLVLGLVKLVEIAGGGCGEQSLAFFLLLGARYIVGDILPMASRDLGYWTMMLWAVNYLILYYQHAKLKHAFYWQGFAILALLFRIEGAMQLLALPLFGFVFRTQASQMRQRLLPYTFVMIGTVLIFATLVIKGLNVNHLGRIQELFTGFSDIQYNFTHNLTARVEWMRDKVIGEPFKEFAWFTFLLSMFSIITAKCLSVAGWAPTILAIWQRKYIQQRVEATALKFLLCWLLVSWVIGSLIAFKVNILSGRYVGLFGLVLIVLASFGLLCKYSQFKEGQLKIKSKALLIFCTLLVSVNIIGSMAPKRDGYIHEIDAVNYVKQQAKTGERILYTTPRQRFYADAPYDGRSYDDWEYLTTRIKDGRVNDYSYLVIHLDIKPDTAEKEAYLNEQLSQFKLDKNFYGYKKKKRVLVYKRIEG